MVIGVAPAPTSSVSGNNRLAGLDGIRGLAALFVVLHHCWLLAFPGYPSATGPWWSNWLLYGHFAVVVFIVLSGFSLAVAPARRDWQLGGLSRFAHRRAWRILPPYWAALTFSLLIAWFVVPQPGAPTPDAKSVVVYGLLIQDLIGAATPNGAFWSIAIEAQLYLVFPLLLWILRRYGPGALLGGITALVMAIGALAPHVSLVDMLMRLTPQFAALFTLGVVAAGILRAGPRWRNLPWGRLALGLALPVVGLVVWLGPEWTVENFFWVDLALGPAFGALLAGIAVGRPAPVVRLLDTAPVRRLGTFSYSLYLIHAPIVVMVYTLLVAPALDPGLPRFIAMLLVAAPLSIVAASMFARVFEIPFTRHRTWPDLRAALLPRPRLPR